MDKAYDRIIWKNQPSTSTALGATNLNKMDVAINTIDDRVVGIDTSKANQSTVNTVVQSITYNESSGVLTITKVNGTSTTIDTKLEKLAVNFVYNPETQQLDITLDDGTVQHVDMSSLVTQYEFEDTDTVSFSVESDGTIKAGIIPGSITGEYLQPDYLADIIVQANISVTNANKSKRYAVGGVESGDTTDNAKYYKEQAEIAAAEAEAIAGFNPLDYYKKNEIDEFLDDRDNAINDLSLDVLSKANQSDLNSTNYTLSQKSNQSDLNTISDSLSDLQDTVDSNYLVLDGKINSQASGSPKGTYATLSALTAAYPAGNSNIYLVTADGNWYYWNGGAWTAGGVYQSTGIANNSISEEKLSFVPVNGIPSKNKFNKATATVGYYVRYQDGALISNASYSASDFIPVLPSTAYRVSGSGGEQGAFYDINKNYISGLVFMGDLSTTPSNCYYLRLTVRNENIDITQVEKGTVVTPYEPYGNKIKASQIIGLTSISYTNIVVDVNGGGDYTNISSAVASISGNSYYNRYNIIIKSGTYDIFPNLTTTELGNYGIDVPDYVNLIGEGNPILKGEIPSGTANLDNTTRISTINVTRNNELKNLTITAKNMRYAVHDDSGNSIKNWERKVENCTFIHYGNDSGLWLYANAWGEGCSSGSRSYFKNCKFISYTTNPAYSTHNNVSFSTASYHEFDNCQFLCLVNGGVSARFGSMGSGQTERVLMKGCSYTGYISIIEELGNGVGIDFKFDGYSNQKNTYGFSYTSANNYLKNLAFEDEVYIVLNISGSSISAKDVVKSTGINQVSVMASSDTAVRFYGVALESISNGSYGKVRVNGYIRLSDTNISSVSVGDKIGIVSGALTVVTSGDYIGICDVAGYIRLIGK